MRIMFLMVTTNPIQGITTIIMVTPAITILMIMIHTIGNMILMDIAAHLTDVIRSTIHMVTTSIMVHITTLTDIMAPTTTLMDTMINITILITDTMISTTI